MKKIKLTQGKYAIVDNADFAWLNQYKWFVMQGYAARNGVKKNGKRDMIRMHRLIMGLSAHNPLEVDHINNIRFDNRRSNLRVVTSKVNAYKRLKYSNNTSGFKGVWFVAKLKKWRACIKKDKKRLNLGYFKSKKEAAFAYNSAARKIFGKFFIAS